MNSLRRKRMRFNELLVLAVAASALATTVTADFAEEFDVKANIRVNYLSKNSDQIESFLGNQTHKDHFKLLRSDGVSLLIGARNVVYNLSLADLTENVDQRITWPSIHDDRELCLMKGRSEDECQNYIRVLAQTDPKNLLVCGTNSYKPKCRTYTSLPVVETIDNSTTKTTTTKPIEGGFFRMKHEFSGQGICPHDPKHNSTAVFAGGELYSGTAADFSGSDALIYRDQVRTVQYDLKQLNDPDFVSSLEDEHHVYFFFREAAVEYINCGKNVYSRVARVCKNDRGGPHRFENNWTTFLKSRLNCSIPGDFPFYFNEIQGTSSSFAGKDKLIYGVFSTPENSISGSAICAFRLSDILRSFDGEFKGQSNQNANWLPVRDVSLPKPRPGSCSADSKNLTEATVNFVKAHSLMDHAVDNVYASPLFVKTSFNERLAVVAVDPQVRTPADGKTYDVVYVGTTRGKVMKVISVEDKSRRKPVVVEEMQVFPYHVPVANIQVVRSKTGERKKLVVLSDHEVKALPLHRCNAVQVQTCKACVALQDPHCAWNVNKGKCVDSTHFEGTDASSLLQDVFKGRHAGCSSESMRTISSKSSETTNASDKTTNEKENSESPGSGEEDEVDIVIDFAVNEQEFPYVQAPFLDGEVIYTGANVTTASVVTAVVALLVGFVSGFLASKKCDREGYRNCGHHYLERQARLNKQHETSALHTGYTQAPCNNLTSSTSSSNATSTMSTASTASHDQDHKNSNLLVNLATKSDPEKNNITGVTGGTDIVITCNETIPRNGTLCKKVYL